ncbi:RTX toxin putative [Vibrio ponticus]|nr:RTX toxin putative [Vibrio ponticus]
MFYRLLIFTILGLAILKSPNFILSFKISNGCDTPFHTQHSNMPDWISVYLAGYMNKNDAMYGSDIRLEFHSSNTIDNKAYVKSAINFTGYQYTLSLPDLQDYAQGTSTTSPSETTYTSASIINVRTDNLSDYNQELINQSSNLDFTTTPNVQALVDAINSLDDYADGTTTTAPSLATYHTAGFDELKDVNLALMNAALLNNTLSTLTDIQTALLALETLVNYALDDTSTAPTVDDYTNAGVTSVSSTILDYLNSNMDKEQRMGFTHYLKASNVHANDYYGWSTAISADGMTVAVLGRDAPTTSSATDDGGAIYLYRREGGTWQEVNILRTNQTTYHAHDLAMSNDGSRLVMAGETMTYVFDAVIVNGQPDWGGTWSMTSINTGVTHSYSTVSISADGKVLVIGDYGYSSFTGRVRIYQFTDESWNYRTQFIGGSSSYFGFSSALSSNGDVIAVGAADQGNTGYVYVYRHNDSNWALEQSFRNANYATDDYFGEGVSINAGGDRIAVGARLEDGATNSLSGQGLFLCLITMAVVGVKHRYYGPVMQKMMISLGVELN